MAAIKKTVQKSSKKSGKVTTEMKHEKFCVEYRKNGGNITAAARAAGYSEKTAAQQGSRLLKNVKIQTRIEQLARDAIRKNIISTDKRAAVLSKIAESVGEDANARIRAIDVLNKMDGVYVIKHEITFSGSLAVQLKERRAKYG